MTHAPPPDTPAGVARAAQPVATVAPPEFTAPGGSSVPVTVAERGAWAALITFLVISRVAVAPDFLLEWDSANYALGMRDFDVYEHQPHAPGSPVFIALLNLAALFVNGETAPFLLVNAILGSAVLLGVGYLLRRVTGPLGAWLCAAGVSLSPPFWYHGAASTAYVAECFCSIAAACLALAMARRQLGLGLGMLLAGLSFGIRPSGVITLLPVVLVGAALGRPPLQHIKPWIVGGVAGVVAVLLWAVPNVVLSGGWLRFSAANSALSDWQLDLGSVLGGDFSQVVPRSERLARYLFDAGTALWPLLLVALLVRARAARVSPRSAAFFVAWLLPGTATYVFHHLAKSGYVLTLVPVFFTVLGVTVAGALALLEPSDRRNAKKGVAFLAAVYAILNVAGFTYAIPGDLLLRKDAYWSDLPNRVLLTGDYGRFGLRYRTHAAKNVDAIVDDLDPEEDLVVFLFGSHELHRLQLYYHPDHWLVATSVDHGLVHSTMTDTTFGDFQLTVLRAPRTGLTWTSPTQLTATQDALVLDREELSLPLLLDRPPRRIVVLYTCPPCTLPLGPGLVEIAHPSVGAGFQAAVLAPECPMGPAEAEAEAHVKFSLAGATCMQ